MGTLIFAHHHSIAKRSDDLMNISQSLMSIPYIKSGRDSHSALTSQPCGDRKSKASDSITHSAAKIALYHQAQFLFLPERNNIYLICSSYLARRLGPTLYSPAQLHQKESESFSAFGLK